MARESGATITDSRPLPPPPGGTLQPSYPHRVAVAILIAILLGGLAYLAWRAAHTILLAFGGILFGLFLSALAEWLGRRTGIRHRWALAAVVLAILIAGGGIGYLIASDLASQLASLWQTLPHSLERIRQSLSQYAWGRQLLEQAPQAVGATTAKAEDLLSRMTGFVSGVSSFLVGAAVILFVGLFVAAEPELYKDGAIRLVPAIHRQRAAQTFDAVGFNLRWWLVGQAVLMATMAVTTALGLYLIGVPLPLALGLIAGIFELVPYLGPWLSAVPAALIALMVSPWHLGMVLGLYLVLHILEGYVLVPLIQRRAVRLPPALTVVAQFLFAEVFGILGLFVAAPLTVAVVVALKMLYVEDALGDRTVNVPGEKK